MVQPHHCVSVHGCGKCRCVGHVAGHSGNRRAPPGKCVGVLGVRCLRGCFAVIGGRRAEGNCLIRFQHRAVVVQPSRGVGVHGCGKCRCVGSLASHSGNRRTPPGEGVGVLGVRCLGRFFAIIGGCRAVCNCFVGFQHRAVVIQPRHGVGVHDCGECRRICSVASHSGNRRTPPGKDVGVLGIRCFDRHFAVIGGCRAEGNCLIRFQHRAVVIQPCHGVSVHGCGKGRCVGHVAGHSGNRRTPPGKGVGVLGIRCFDRCFAVIGRHCAVCHRFVGFQHHAVVIQPRHCVSGHDCGECRRVSYIASDSRNSRTPPGEGVGVLGVRCLDRRFVVIGGCCAVCN